MQQGRELDFCKSCQDGFQMKEYPRKTAEVLLRAAVERVVMNTLEAQ